MNDMQKLKAIQRTLNDYKKQIHPSSIPEHKDFERALALREIKKILEK